MNVGNVELCCVSDGVGWWDGGGAFGLVPKTRWQELLPADEHNRVPMVLRCLLVRSAGKTIVVDTGLGAHVTPEVAARQDFDLRRPAGGLLDDLARRGVQPAEVDVVLLTHLHADHCGGSTIVRNGQRLAAFPRAEYWVQRREWEDAQRPNERTRATYLGENFEPLRQAGQLRLLDGDTPVTDEVRTVVTPGHTPGHQSVLVESGGQVLFFTGDLAIWRWNLERLAWVTAYDVEPLVTIETKRRWQAWLAERQALIVFDHDPLVELGRLRRVGQRYTLDVIRAAGLDPCEGSETFARV